MGKRKWVRLGVRGKRVNPKDAKARDSMRTKNRASVGAATKPLLSPRPLRHSKN
jgi:hypothetical protein